MTDGLNATPSQLARAERSLAAMHARQVPVGPDAPLVEDDRRIEFRPAAEVARRALVLLCVVQRAEATPHDLVLRRMNDEGLWETASPEETRFLRCKVPEEEDSRRLVWRMECVSVLMWALGHQEHLDWPADRCDVSWLGLVLDVRLGIRDLVASAALRPGGEILDALDLSMRICTAVDDAQRNGQPVPLHLDWSETDTLRPVDEVKAVQVVRQRCRALKWLVRSGGRGWDELDDAG